MGSTVVFDLRYSAFDVPLETSSRDVFFFVRCFRLYSESSASATRLDLK